jgi:hypothetical protein
MTPSGKETRELSDLERWQIEEIKKGLEEADRGEFASDEEVQQTLKRLTRRSRTRDSPIRTKAKNCVDRLPAFCFFQAKNGRHFFQRLPQFFHIAIPRKPVLGKDSRVHWKCQHFSTQAQWLQPGACDGRR